jgi:hypothetical protein
MLIFIIYYLNILHMLIYNEILFLEFINNNLSIKRMFDEFIKLVYYFIYFFCINIGFITKIVLQ